MGKLQKNLLVPQRCGARVGGARPSSTRTREGAHPVTLLLSVVASIGHAQTFSSCPNVWGNISAHC